MSENDKNNKAREWARTEFPNKWVAFVDVGEDIELLTHGDKFEDIAPELRKKRREGQFIIFLMRPEGYES